MPNKRNAITLFKKTKCGEMRVVFDHDPASHVLEGIAISLGKSGACGHSQCKGWAGMLNTGIVHGWDLEKICDRVEGNDCNGLVEGVSCSTAIAQVLRKYFTNRSLNIGKFRK